MSVVSRRALGARTLTPSRRRQSTMKGAGLGFMDDEDEPGSDLSSDGGEV